jgi:integrase
MMHAVDAYEVALRERGLAAVSVTRARAHLDVTLRLDVNAGRRLAWLTPRRAAELYQLVQQGRAVDTHRNALSVAKSFGRFVTDRGWLPADPFATVKPIGRRNRGKPQLRVDEARRLVDRCFEEASRESIAVATALMLGLGATETVGRQVRDLDDGGRWFVVSNGKNRFRERVLEVPEDLRAHLLELAKGRAGAAFLFGAGELDRPTRYWIYYHCERLCLAAKVPVVPPHGLRGTHSTLAVGAVSTAHSVAAALAAAGGSLGHAPGSPVTATTYVAPGAVDTARQRAAMRVLQGGAGNSEPGSGYQRSKRSG